MQKKYFASCSSKLKPIDNNDEASDHGLVADWVDGFFERNPTLFNNVSPKLKMGKLWC